MRMYNCLVIIIDYRLALHAIILMGGAAASETLIGGYFCTIGGCSTPQRQPRENTGQMYKKHKKDTYNGDVFLIDFTFSLSSSSQK